MNTSIAAMVAVLVLAGAVATLRPAQRAVAVCAGIGVFAVAGVLAWTEARWVLDPETWLLAASMALGALTHVSRIGQGDVNHDRSEVR